MTTLNVTVTRRTLEITQIQHRTEVMSANVMILKKNYDCGCSCRRPLSRVMYVVRGINVPVESQL